LRYNRFFTILLAHYFPLKKLELSARKQKDSMMQSTLTTMTPKVWPPQKKHYFTVGIHELIYSNLFPDQRMRNQRK
jgi:hypothetical protein